TLTLINYKLRNKNNAVFEFTKRILPEAFTGIDFSSVDNNGKSFNGCFGANGLDSNSDFLVLENPSGQVIDRVTWEGTTKLYYNRDSVLTSYTNPAPSGVTTSIGRTGFEGNDTDIDSSDFSQLSARNYGARNNNYGGATSNTLNYPSSDMYIPKNFKVELKLGEDSSSGNNDTLWFIRIGGSTDTHSPHIYYLSELGISLNSTSVQVSTITGITKQDIDGNTLVDGAVYRLIFNTDNSTASATQIVLDNLTYDATMHYVVASDCVPLFKTFGSGKKEAVLKVSIRNNSPINSNNIRMKRVKIKIDDGNGNPLTTSQAQGLFESVFVVYNSTDVNNVSRYEVFIDTVVIGNVDNSNFNLVSGYQEIIISTHISVSPQNTGEFFVVVDISTDAYSSTPNSVKFEIECDVDVEIEEEMSKVKQDILSVDNVITSSATIIDVRPDITGWPRKIGEGKKIYKKPAWDFGLKGDLLAVVSEDGKLYLKNSDGTDRWSSPFTPQTLSPIKCRPEWILNTSYIIFGNENGDVYCVEDQNGTPVQKWTRSFPEAVRAVTSSGDDVYISCNDGNIYRVTLDAGTDVWSANLGTPIKTGIYLNEGWKGVYALWAGGESGRVFRVNLNDGTVDSYMDTGGEVLQTPFVSAGYYSPILDKNIVFIGSSDGKLYARDGANLTTIPSGWTVSPGATDGYVDVGSPITSNIYYNNGYVFFGTEDGRVYRVEASSGIIEGSWPYQADSKILTVADWKGYLYFTTENGYLYAITDGNTPSFKSGYPVNIGIPLGEGFVLDVISGKIYIPGLNGRIYGIKY
ncbi:MAG: hypothetical protein DRI22_01965, partial [Caldiserica bacterium]